MGLWPHLARSYAQLESTKFKLVLEIYYVMGIKLCVGNKAATTRKAVPARRADKCLMVSRGKVIKRRVGRMGLPSPILLSP